MAKSTWAVCVAFALAAMVCVSRGLDTDTETVRAMELFYGQVENYRTKIQDWNERLSHLELQVNALSPEGVITLGSKKRQESIASCEDVVDDFYGYISDISGIKDAMKDAFRGMFRIPSLGKKDLQHLAELQLELLPGIDNLIAKAHRVMGRAVQYQSHYEDAEENDPDVQKCNMCKRITSVLYSFSQDLAERAGEATGFNITPETVCRTVEKSGEESFTELDEETCLTVARNLLSGGSTDAILPSAENSEHMKEWHMEMKKLITKEQVAQLFCQDADLCDIDESLSETVLESLSAAIVSESRIASSSNEQCTHSTGASFCMLSSYCTENDENPCGQGSSCECYTGPSSTTVKVYAAFQALKGIGGAMMYASAGPAMMLAGAFGTMMMPAGDFEISTILSALINTVLYGKPRCKCLQLSCSSDKIYGCRLYGPHEGFMNLVHKKPTPKNPNWHIPEPGYKCAKGALGMCWLTPCGDDETAVGGVLNADGEPQGVFNCQTKSAEELGIEHTRMMKRRMYRFSAKEIAEAEAEELLRKRRESDPRLPDQVLSTAPPVVKMHM